MSNDTDRAIVEREFPCSRTCRGEHHAYQCTRGRARAMRVAAAIRAAVEAEREERPALCDLCRGIATGYAFIDNQRYCHGGNDQRPTCYERAQWRGLSP